MALKWLSTTQSSTQYSIDIIVTEDHLPDQIISWDNTYIMGVQMLDVYVNGIYQKGSLFYEYDPNSIQFTEEDYLSIGDVVSIRYNASTIDLGDIRVVSTYADLLDINNPIMNEVALVVTQRKLYKFGENGWEELMIPFTTQNIGVLFSHELQEVVDITERTYELQDISYSVGMGNLLVFIDGKKVDPSNYTEVDNITIVFNEDLPEGSQEIEFVVANTDSWEDSNNHNIEYTYYTNDNIHEEIIRKNNVVVKHTTFDYDTKDNIVRETVVKGSKTIIKEYSYDTRGNITNVDVEVIN